MKARLQSVERFTLFEIDLELHYCRKIPEHPGYYASTQGDIISAKGSEPSVMLTQDNGRGYRYTNLFTAGRPIKRYVHRLVAAAFLQAPDADPKGSERKEINHLDSNPSNNRVSNIEWSSSSENKLHAHMMKGVRNVQI